MSLRLAIVAGEESGDLLGADLVAALKASGQDVTLTGVGGAHLQAEGMVTLFDPAEIALMGLSAIVRSLPRLMRRIRQTAAAILAAKPDVLVIIDSPEFTHRVAKRVRAADPSIRIVNYVCPSVWAWRPERAPAMRAYVDLVLCLLPFEPAELARLGGPDGVYVGHRLANDPGLLAARAENLRRAKEGRGLPRQLLVLPGSRRSEVRGLLAPFGKTIAELMARGNHFDVTIPTVSHVRALVEEGVRDWSIKPAIVSGPDEKWRAFGQADAALAASGTVTLELALAGVPMVSAYKTDLLFRLIEHKITLWTASLPNIIADRVIVPEYINAYVRPGNMARVLEQLMADGPVRAAQMDGFAEIARRMAVPRPSGDLAAAAVLGKQPIANSE